MLLVRRVLVGCFGMKFGSVLKHFSAVLACTHTVLWVADGTVSDEAVM